MGGEPRNDALPRRAWPAAILGVIIGNASPMMQPLLVGIYVDKMHFDVSAAGYISAGELAGLAIAAMLISRYIDRYSLRVLGVGACLLFGLANVASIQATSIWAVVIARVAAGVGAGAALAAGSAIAARTHSPERVFALAFAGITLYGLLFFPSAARLIESYGPAGLYWTKAALGMLAIVTIAACLPWTSADGGSSRREPLAVDAGAIARQEGRTRVLACGFLLYVGHGAVWTYEERMGVRAGLSAVEIGHAFALASIAGCAGAMIAAALGTRIGRTVPQLIALSLSMIAAILIIATEGPIWFTASACLIALSWFYGVPYLAGVASALDPDGRLAGALSGIMSAGIALGPFIGASIISTSFVPIGWLAAAAYMVCCVLILGPSRRTDGVAERETGRNSAGPQHISPSTP